VQLVASATLVGVGEIAALLLALYVFIGPVNVHRADGPITWTLPDGTHAAAFGITTCNEGVPSIEIEAKATDAQLAHELLHAAACVDAWRERHETSMQAAGLDPTACRLVQADCAHSWVYWGLRNPESAERLLTLHTAAGPTLSEHRILTDAALDDHVTSTMRNVEVEAGLLGDDDRTSTPAMLTIPGGSGDTAFAERMPGSRGARVAACDLPALYGSQRRRRVDRP
jgi:hypothetical protein